MQALAETITASVGMHEQARNVLYFAFDVGDTKEFDPISFDELGKVVGCDHSLLFGQRPSDRVELSFVVIDTTMFCFPKEYLDETGHYYAALRTRGVTGELHDAGQIAIFYADSTKKVTQRRYIFSYGFSLYSLDLNQSNAYRIRNLKPQLDQHFTFEVPPGFM